MSSPWHQWPRAVAFGTGDCNALASHIGPRAKRQNKIYRRKCGPLHGIHCVLTVIFIGIFLFSVLGPHHVMEFILFLPNPSFFH
jgi:hypothetical protein